MRNWLGRLASLLIAGLCCAQTTGPAEDAGVAVYVGKEMVKGYRPTPALVRKETPVVMPKFPVVDIHCHWSIYQDPVELIKAMDALGMSKAVDLSGGYGDYLDRMIEKFHMPYPDRVFVLCNIDWKKIDDPTFGQDVTAYLKSAKGKGASGLKIFKDLGLNVKDKTRKIVSIDDPRLEPVWKTCGELKMPILMHSGDPVAFFQPVDEHNERWMQLKRHPDWTFYGPQFPTWEQVLQQHVSVIQKHPGTVFISAHLANCGEDLQRLASIMDRCPNMYADISGRVAEIGRQPYSARKFLIKYQDRILFGTDRYPGRTDQERNSVYYRFLETDDEYFDYYNHPFPPEGEWKIYGVFLPDEVLKKIYHENADRALAGEMPLH